jgi:hypothetical protein
MSPLLPRPGLVLTGFIASSTFLLEHAAWAYGTKKSSAEIDIEVFRRWTIEGGLKGAIDDASRANANSDERAKMNSSLVFGNEFTLGSRSKL